MFLLGFLFYLKEKLKSSIFFFIYISPFLETYKVKAMMDGKDSIVSLGQL